MLAQSFLTADKLRITNEEHRALIQVLGMLERNELAHVHNLDRSCGFNMGWARNDNECGTIGCIAGWAHKVSNGKAFPWADEAYGFESAKGNLHELFVPQRSAAADTLGRITPAQAAIALRNYLTTGKPNWDEALA